MVPRSFKFTEMIVQLRDCLVLTHGMICIVIVTCNHSNMYINVTIPCSFNQLDLPPYETYNKLRTQLLLAIRECPEGFGFA